MFLIEDIIVRDTPGKGRGVFAAKDIPGGTVIAEYSGILRPADSYSYGDLVYEMYYSDTVDICPEVDSIGMHLVNHSCEANCGTGNVGRRTLLFALRKIFAGEELGYDYFLGVEDEDDKGGSANCHCGSQYCRGTMYSNPAQYALLKKWEEENLLSLPHDQPAPFGEMLPRLPEYPKTMEDDLLFSIFGARDQQPVEGRLDLLNSPRKVRDVLRESGKRIEIEGRKVIIEGILFTGVLLLEPVE